MSTRQPQVDKQAEQISDQRRNDHGINDNGEMGSETASFIPVSPNTFHHQATLVSGIDPGYDWENHKHRPW